MITYNAEKGMNCFFALSKALEIAKLNEKNVEAIFNNIVIIVRPTSNVEDITTIYFLKHEITRLTKPLDSIMREKYDII